jgi:hypothetical protein
MSLSHDEIFSIIVGRTLRYERRKYELDQDFLAERIGLSQPGVSKIERLGRCGLPVFYKYCLAIETTPIHIIEMVDPLHKTILEGEKVNEKVPDRLDWTTKTVANWCDDVFANWDKEASGEIEEEDTTPIIDVDEEF